MANYKFVDADELNAGLQMIADAIKAKTGDNSALAFPTGFASEIANITGGGGGSSADERVKYVTFMCGAAELIKYPVISGDTCRDPVTLGLIDKPSKDSTPQYTYEHNGWSLTDGGSASASALTNVTEDRTVYAAFRADLRMYTITWLDEDGTELPGQKQWAYGTVPSYVPSKDGALWTGWTPEPVAVTGDATYTAQWKTVITGSCGTNATWELADGVLTISGTGAIKNYTTDTGNAPAPWKDYRDEITELVINEGITSIGQRAFMSLKGITQIYLPDSVTTVETYAFAYCSNVENISAGDALQSIGSFAFASLSKVGMFGFIRRTTTKAIWSCSQRPNNSITEGISSVKVYGLYYLATMSEYWNYGPWTKKNQ